MDTRGAALAGASPFFLDSSHYSEQDRAMLWEIRWDAGGNRRYQQSARLKAIHPAQVQNLVPRGSNLAIRPWPYKSSGEIAWERAWGLRVDVDHPRAKGGSPLDRSQLAELVSEVSRWPEEIRASILRIMHTGGGLLVELGTSEAWGTRQRWERGTRAVRKALKGSRWIDGCSWSCNQPMRMIGTQNWRRGGHVAHYLGADYLATARAGARRGRLDVAELTKAGERTKAAQGDGGARLAAVDAKTARGLLDSIKKGAVAGLELFRAVGKLLATVTKAATIEWACQAFPGVAEFLKGKKKTYANENKEIVCSYDISARLVSYLRKLSGFEGPASGVSHDVVDFVLAARVKAGTTAGDYRAAWKGTVLTMADKILTKRQKARRGKDATRAGAAEAEARILAKIGELDMKRTIQRRAEELALSSPPVGEITGEEVAMAKIWTIKQRQLTKEKIQEFLDLSIPDRIATIRGAMVEKGPADAAAFMVAPVAYLQAGGFGETGVQVGNIIGTGRETAHGLIGVCERSGIPPVVGLYALAWFYQRCAFWPPAVFALPDAVGQAIVQRFTPFDETEGEKEEESHPKELDIGSFVPMEAPKAIKAAGRSILDAWHAIKGKR